MASHFGTAVRVQLFGESHGPVVGAVLEGLAPGIAVDAAFVAAEMDKRRPYSDAASTPRREEDAVEFCAGLYQGHTTGAPLALVIRNKQADPAAYAGTATLPRPGHADYATMVRSFGYVDLRGGGHASGRLTAPLVAAGAVCRQILAGRGILIGSRLCRCAGVEDAPLPEEETELRAALRALNQKHFAVLDEAAGQRMQEAIQAAREEGDSVGGVVETTVLGPPAGVGEPLFGAVESVLAGMLFGIPGVKGVDFGLGFGFADAPGSAVADEWEPGEEEATTLPVGTNATAEEKTRPGAKAAEAAVPPAGEENTPPSSEPAHRRPIPSLTSRTNHSGGVNGGITNGLPLRFRTVIRAAPSIEKPLQSVDLSTGRPRQVSTRGRHDAAIAVRARAAIDAACAIALLDLLCQRYGMLWQNPQLAP